MLRIAAFLLLVAGLGALFGPRRYRLFFWLGAAAALAYTALRLAGIVDGPTPRVHGVR
jgi:hypothetical protein